MGTGEGASSVDDRASTPRELAKDLESGTYSWSGPELADHPVAGEPDSSLRLARLVSKTSLRASSIIEPGPPPDGGALAWVQVLLGHLVIFCTWGYINSFGVFQTYYVDHLGHSPSDISWIGSIQIFLLFAIGTFSGRATDAGYYKLCFSLGAFAQILGVFMTSICTQYWQLLLAQGICTGIGNGLLFCPTVSLISTYFTRKRALAIAIFASGSSTGGMVFPGIVEGLLPKVGFGWTVRVIGFIMLAISLLAGTFIRPRLPPRRTGPIVEWVAFKEPPYLLFAVGSFLMFWGLYPAFYYIGEYGSKVLRVDQADSINLLLIMNGVGIAGRLLPGFVADRFTGPINLLIPGALSGGIMLYSWYAVSTRSGLFIFASLYGIAGSMLQGLFPAALSSLTTDMKKMGVRMGMVFTIISFACLTGSPIAGALIQIGGGQYLYAQLFAGTSLVIAAATLVASRVAATGWNLSVKV
jgi:MFS family permease